MTRKQILALVRKILVEHQNEPRIQIREFNKLLKQAQASHDIYFIGLVFYSLGAAYNEIGERDMQISCAMKAIPLLTNAKEYRLTANSYTTLGAAYFYQENYQIALDNYDKAYDLVKKHRIRGTSRMAVVNNIATCYCVMEDYRSGIRYLNECIELTKKEQPDNAYALMIFAFNLSDCYIKLKEPEKAAEILADTAQWAEKSNMKVYICDYHLRCALNDFELNNKRSGNKNVDTALKMLPKVPDIYPVYPNLSKLVRCLLNNNDRKRADVIIEYFVEYGKKYDDTIDQLLFCRTMGDYYKSIGEPEQAVDYYSRLDELYEKRTSELKRIQLNIRKRMKEADSSIVRLNKMIKESEERANREPMTKLLNRAAMLRIAGEFIETAAKKKKKVGAIFIDIDFFKECNDTYGHAKGDEIIREVAAACRKEVNSHVRFARYGGDEFLGVTCGLEDGAVTDIARRISDNIRKADIPNEKNPNGHRVTLSVGVVNVPITEKTDTIIQIANYADKAVYHSKSAGKNCIHLLDHGRTGEDGEDEPFVKIEF